MERPRKALKTTGLGDSGGATGYGSGIVTTVAWVAAVHGFSPWPGNFHMPPAWPKEGEKKKMTLVDVLGLELEPGTGIPVQCKPLISM